MNQNKLLFYCLGVIFVYVIVVVLKGNTNKSSSNKVKQDAATNYDKSQDLGNALSNITKTYTM